MTPCSLSLTVLLPSTLFILASFYGPASAEHMDHLQCNESSTEDVEKFSCGINSTIMVEFNKKIMYDQKIFDIQFNCYNATPLKIKLPLEKSFPNEVKKVQFNSCRFSANDDISEILTHSLRLNSAKEIEFENKQIDIALSRAHLRRLHGSVNRLSFTIRNVSTLPTDLLADFKNLLFLSINSESSDSSHLSLLFAPLINLRKMVLQTNNLHKISEHVFANQWKLEYLTLKLNGMTALTTNSFSNLIQLRNITLVGNSFSLKDQSEKLPLENEKRKESYLKENQVVLKGLPGSLLREFPSLFSVKITNCQLDSIPSNLFTGSRSIYSIDIQGNSLHELPIGLFGEQKNLWILDLRKNRIRTLADGLFSSTKKLRYLDLSDNLLTKLSNDIFKPLTNLHSLRLENNNLLTISLDYNQPQPGSVFDNLNKLFDLRLKNNSINEIPYSTLSIKQNQLYLDLSFNNISSIDCNFVQHINSKININGNPINCDCKIMCLHQHMIQNVHEWDKTPTSKAFQCLFPIDLKGRFLYDLKPSEVLCNVSKGCTYDIRTADSVLVMNCSGGNFIDIPMLPTFDQSFSNGIELFMDNNPLTELSSRTLRDNANISMLSISGSPITKLPVHFLTNLPKLRNVSLVLPSLEDIFQDIFDESTEIHILKISGTIIEVLPGFCNSFEGKIIVLDLSRNKFKAVDKCFLYTSSLKVETLRLSFNFFESLPGWAFNGLHELKTLFLNNNGLRYIDPDIFDFTPKLEFINVENNQLKTIQPFVRLFGTLTTLFMGNNSVGNDYFIGIERISTYTVIDLSFNNISSVDLSHLLAISADNFFFNFHHNDIKTIQLQSGNISLNCECNIISFEKLNKQMSMYESLRCLSPGGIKGHHVTYLSPKELLCPKNSICPEGCHCWIRPVNLTLIVNCSNKNLTDVPLLPELESFFRNGIELSIDHNQLTSLNPRSQSGYKGVNKVFAAHNKITNISNEDIPENMTYLDVSYNRIERLDDEVIKVMSKSQTLKSVLLHNNSIKCDCSSENLTRFIVMNETLFPVTDQCADGRKFSSLHYAEICSVEQRNTAVLFWLVICIVLTVTSSTLLFLSYLYSKNKETILVWMYAHKFCLCWVTEEEVDKDRKYDAFLSYSSLDAEFVARELVSKLESGEKPYKLCLHDRDWLGGGFIPDQIEKSVQRSKRTLVLMTQNYLKSQWARLEFRVAHTASLNEKRIRVIVIIVGDINTDNLDPDLRRYIKMYTYIRFDDPWFWKKLCYALPHPTKKNERSRENKFKMIRRGDAGSNYSSDSNILF